MTIDPNVAIVIFAWIPTMMLCARLLKSMANHPAGRSR